MKYVFECISASIGRGSCEFPHQSRVRIRNRTLTQLYFDSLDSIFGNWLSDSVNGQLAANIAALRRIDTDKPSWVFDTAFWTLAVGDIVMPLVEDWCREDIRSG